MPGCLGVAAFWDRAYKSDYETEDVWVRTNTIWLMTLKVKEIWSERCQDACGQRKSPVENGASISLVLRKGWAITLFLILSRSYMQTHKHRKAFRGLSIITWDSVCNTIRQPSKLRGVLKTQLPRMSWGMLSLTPWFLLEITDQVNKNTAF